VPATLPQPPTVPTLVLTRAVGHDALRGLFRAGNLIQVRRGAYAVPPGAEEPWLQAEYLALARCAAVTAALTCTFALSHQSAALVHGCWTGPLDGLTHVTQRTQPSSAGTRGVRRHFADLPSEDMTVVNGLPVTTLERTMEDCARMMHPREGLCVADSGMRMLGRPDRLYREASEARLAVLRADLLERVAAKAGWRGAVRARAVLDFADGFSESPGETRLRWVAVSRGLPRPVCQHPVTTTLGTFYVDLGWSVARREENGAETVKRTIVEEYDGESKYVAAQTSPATNPLYAEKRREDALRRTHASVRRRTKHDLADPDALFRDMCTSFPASTLNAIGPVPGLMWVGPEPVTQ